MRLMPRAVRQLSFRRCFAANDSSGRQAGRSAHAEKKSWNLRPECGGIWPHEVVVTFHESFAGLENAETLVLVHASGCDNRLLADDSLPFDFGVFADRVVNQPAP